MFSFFKPTTKVQKDRAIMRETDARLAKYSRRGLIFNFVAFLLVLLSGNLVEKEPGLAIILTVGLLLATILRAYFLFRFDTLYPRAPAKWRNRYFFATLLGAAWWGVILVSVTLVLQMRDEAPLLWLYTVVFFSTTAHAFAPYQRFLSVYQFMGQVPAAVAALFVPDLDAYLYSVLMVAFYLMLVHQCRHMSEDYWQKLSATYALAKKTENLEEEKRGTRATVQLNQEFMNNLHSDLATVVEMTHSGMDGLSPSGQQQGAVEQLEEARGRQAQILSNVDDFCGLLSKDLVLQNRVFNVRHELQELIRQAVIEADVKGVEIESALSPTIPMRLEGDAVRFAQIIRTVLATVTRDVSNCFVLIEADFLREFESSGDLQVTVSRQFYGKRRHHAPEETPESILENLELSVCKGLADAMDGRLVVKEDRRGESQVRFRAKFVVPEHNSQIDFRRDIFGGRRVLLVHHNASLLEVKRRELDALGVTARTEMLFRRAYQTLVNSYKSNAPIEAVQFYMNAHTPEALEFSQGLLDHKDLRHTHQLVVCSREEFKQENAGNPMVHYLNQPAGLYEIGRALFGIFGSDRPQAEQTAVHLLLVDTGAAVDFGADQLRLAGAEVDVVKAPRLSREQLSARDYKIVVMTCDAGAQAECANVVHQVRCLEKELNQATLVPIVGVGSGAMPDFYEHGFDHYIDLSKGGVDLETTLRYWAEL